ncbi:DUF2750 domain-containing protein, partial [Bacillus vallismortis]|nr:DUF2750 domain-containing protein [Bacillus vallismortis]
MLQLHFWATKEHANHCSMKQWKDTSPESISLDD